MRGILANLLIKLGLDSKEFEKGVDGAKQKTNHFANGIKKIGGILAGAFAVDRIIAFGKELVNLSGVAQGVREAFSRMGGDKFMQDLKNSTSGTVSELGLMKRAVQANNFQIPIKDLAKLFEFATKRAQQTGQSVDYLVDSIVLGIGRKSPLILDNLGISAVMLRQKLKGVGVEMTTVGDIAAAVGEIAEEEMMKSGKVIDTNAIKIQRAGAAWEDFKLKLAESNVVNKIASAGIGILTNSIEALDLALEAFKTKGVTLTDLIGGVNASATAKIVARQIDETNKKRIAAIKHIDEESNEYRNNINAEQESLETKIRHGKTIAEIEDETAKLTESLKTYGVNQQAEIQRTLQQIDANKKLIESLTTLKTKRDNLMPGGNFMIKPITEIPKIGQNLSEMAQSQDTGITTKYGGSALLGTQVSELDKLNAYAAEKLKQGNDMQKELLDERAKIFEQFKQDMAMAVADFGVNVVEEFGQSLGEMIASGNFDFSNFGKNILAGIGGFISQLGKMLIGLGIASEAFQALLKSAFTNPVSAGLAIAAGAALVLLGGAIQGFAKAGPNGASSSGSVSAPSYSRAGSPSSGYRAEDNKVVFEIKGDKLVGVLSNVQRKNLNMA